MKKAFAIVSTIGLSLMTAASKVYADGGTGTSVYGVHDVTDVDTAIALGDINKLFYIGVIAALIAAITLISSYKLTKAIARK
ncbi:hypothetical protein H6763_01770 [Candidatus Nomurabacteria bacterium]|nr:hypothetical protein [Candidatus Nomurabacteria bacterium]MCB9803535.1 hypothetical protein [Candidatus Nomurabacteria bacterium]